jgi:hypothetical protein
MVDADPWADPLAEPRPIMVPAPLPIARVEQMRSGGAPLHERGDKAGMGADVAEPSAWAQHSAGFGEGSLGVVEVGVGQHRDDRVEGAVGERQVGGVGCDQDRAGWTGPLLGDAELVAGQVDPDHPPAPLQQTRDGNAGAAAKVEAAAWSGTDQPAKGVERGGGDLQSADLLVVPVGQAVIARWAGHGGRIARSGGQVPTGGTSLPGGGAVASPGNRLLGERQ